MKIKHFALTTGIAIGATIASGFVTPAHAFTFVLGEDIAAGGRRDINGISTIPLSTAAEGTFRSNLNSYSTQNFDSISIPAPSTDSQTRLFTQGTPVSSLSFPGIGTGTATVGNTSTYVPQDLTSNPPTTFATWGVRFNDTAKPPTENGRFAISGDNYYEVGNGTFTLTFDAPVAAIGFYATDVEDPQGITLQLNNALSTLTIPRTVPTNTDKSALYYGFVAENPSETFTSITFSRSLSNSNDKFGLDDLTVATYSQIKSSSTPVPEPFTIIGTLVGGTAALRMRKKLKSTSKD